MKKMTFVIGVVVAAVSIIFNQSCQKNEQEGGVTPNRAAIISNIAKNFSDTTFLKDQAKYSAMMNDFKTLSNEELLLLFKERKEYLINNRLEAPDLVEKGIDELIEFNKIAMKKHGKPYNQLEINVLSQELDKAEKHISTPNARTNAETCPNYTVNGFMNGSSGMITDRGRPTFLGSFHSCKTKDGVQDCQGDCDYVYTWARIPNFRSVSRLGVHAPFLVLVPTYSTRTAPVAGTTGQCGKYNFSILIGATRVNVHTIGNPSLMTIYLGLGTTNNASGWCSTNGGNSWYLGGVLDPGSNGYCNRNPGSSWCTTSWACQCTVEGLKLK